jgi:hypothetical protein
LWEKGAAENAISQEKGAAEKHIPGRKVVFHLENHPMFAYLNVFR